MAIILESSKRCASNRLGEGGIKVMGIGHVSIRQHLGSICSEVKFKNKCFYFAITCSDSKGRTLVFTWGGRIHYLPMHANVFVLFLISNNKIYMSSSLTFMHFEERV
jgi:hypothetical protein